ncbi:MAG: hypothetical protein LBP87_15605 [Planctomycetaceae bacterium]|jgi:tetratricopeptide (TPR) repeat protein|nr:hypothetical protein [Planctomycetaceae bacterium]
MSNNNLANISTFEQLQSGQNAKTGMNQMNAFQENTTVNNSVADFKKAVDTYQQILKEATDAADTADKAVTLQKKLYDEAINALHHAVSMYEKEGVALEKALKKNPNDKKVQDDKKEFDKVEVVYGKTGGVLQTLREKHISIRRD